MVSAKINTLVKTTIHNCWGCTQAMTLSWGFYSTHNSILLLYEYMPNGNLGELLHGNNVSHLEWDIRYKIAVEAAKGLCYLCYYGWPLIFQRS